MGYINSDDFREGVKRSGKVFGAKTSTDEVNDYSKKLNEAIEGLTQELSAVQKQYSNNITPQRLGQLADRWHEKTLRISAENRGYNVKDLRPHANETGDIRLLIDRQLVSGEVKYHKTVKRTFRALNESKYESIDQKIGPSEQANAFGGEPPIQARATAKRAYSKELASPEVQKLDNSLANEGKIPDHLEKRIFETETALSDAFKASAYAGIIAASIQSAPKIYQALEASLIKGSIDKDELWAAGKSLGENTAKASFISFTAGSIMTGCKSGAFGEAAASADPTVIAAATVMAVNSAKSVYHLHNGDISLTEFAVYNENLVVSVGCSSMGMVIGQSIIPIPILGGVIGSMAGGMIGQAINNKTNIYLSILLGKSPLIAPIPVSYAVTPEEIRLLGLDRIKLDTIQTSQVKPSRLNLAKPNLKTVQYHINQHSPVSFEIGRN